MYQENFVKKRKRIRAVRIASWASLSGATALIIVAFLGRFVGTFTVTLNTGNVELSLSEKKAFETESSFLRVDTLPKFHEYTYSAIKEQEDLIDSEDSDYLFGAIRKKDTQEMKDMNYFKYTFYIKNVGVVDAAYDMAINVMENKPTADNRYIDETLRVAVYANYADSNEHESKVYAKKALVANRDEDGNKVLQEYISVSKDESNELHQCFGLAEMFESSDVVTTLSVKDFRVGEIMRYTLVMWLEGYDPQSTTDAEAPEGASIKLGVTINAYEN